MTSKALPTILLALAWVAMSATFTWALDTRPNIVFVLSDDHAEHAISAYGSKINETPNIDRLAQQGILFENSFCANSLCGPSRASILTGKHSHLNGVMRNGHRLAAKHTTLPKLLQKAGYQTALFGKWHLWSDPLGFDQWEVLPGQGNYYNSDFRQMDGSKIRREGYVSDVITELSLDWLRNQRDHDRPFLLMCHHKAPHRSWAPASRHLGMYDGELVPEPSTLRDDFSGRTELLKETELSLKNDFYFGWDLKFHGESPNHEYFRPDFPDGEYERMTDDQKADWDAHYEPINQEFLNRLKTGELTDDEVHSWKYQRYIKNYLRCVAAVDDSVGRLMDYLDDSGLANNTLFIYASDQGFFLGEHGWYGKRWMFEESLRMPLIMRLPGAITPNTRSKAMVQNIDYLPTLLELADVNAPEDLQGRSMVPLLRGETPNDWRDSIYYAFYENHAIGNAQRHDGVRTDRHKLIFFPRSREWQLFDLDSDPQELTSLDDDPAYDEILSGMKKRYRDIRKFYEVNSAAIPATRGEEKWWRERWESKLAEADQGEFDVVFIGDSITQGWEDVGRAVWEEHYSTRRVLNLGFSGDRTEHVLSRSLYCKFGKKPPKAVVLMLGTNNTGQLNQDPEEIAAGIVKVVDCLRRRLPETIIILHGIFPRGHSPHHQQRLNNVAVNRIIQDLDNRDGVTYLDIGSVFQESDRSISAEIMPDGLHLSDEGYARWAEALEPTLDKLGL